MPDVQLVLRSTRVVSPEGMRAASVAVADGTVAAVLPHDAPVPDGARLEDLGDDVLLPGLVDTHVHVNDPGRTEWEGFWTATRAAAAGGITTLVDMPLNSLPPTTTVDHLRVKRKTAADKAHIDVGFWGGALPGNGADLRSLHEAGVFGFKAFLSPSGVDEFPHLDDDHLARALREIASFDGLLIVHAEDPQQLAGAPRRGGPRYADFLASRPRRAEDTAVARLLEQARRFDARVHVLHLSSADALPLLTEAKADGVRVTVETCPHYLTLTAEEVPDGASEFKCCPPIREAANQDLLWQALADGTVDCVVTDHSPSTADLKTDDFATAWGGISGLQLSLPAVWTEARRRGRTLEDVVRWTATHTARLAGLEAHKGAIAPGHDADFAVLAPDETFTVDPAALQHRNRVTAYAGRTLHGVVRSTWLRGERVLSDGEFTAPKGRLLTRP
ncbi:allantoinase AllB [Streptomyces sp. DSM 41972]|uniref:allantoinase n=1 Tax=Streptomyces althioticus subsp. attaecolombicae TaxID=3075534 RepID=A0ABU3I2Z3_9ACTN|nr:allantoinase AllB [Streptomyces sp. DSM 41972]SCD86982.1 allantoinase [Streptomyces sp. di50b]SCE09809.1 allantoinase [Streptomyces sp. di188]